MVQFVNRDVVPGQYFTVAASQTTQALGAVGKTGDYLDHVTIVPASATPGTVTIFDGTTAIYSIPALTSIAPVNLTVQAYSKTGSWNITTSTSVSVVAVGQFT
jgi:hypothetical protein